MKNLDKYPDIHLTANKIDIQYGYNNINNLYIIEKYEANDYAKEWFNHTDIVDIIIFNNTNVFLAKNTRLILISNDIIRFKCEELTDISRLYKIETIDK